VGFEVHVGVDDDAVADREDTLSRLAYALEADIRFVGRRAVLIDPPPTSS